MMGQQQSRMGQQLTALHCWDSSLFGKKVRYGRDIPRRSSERGDCGLSKKVEPARFSFPLNAGVPASSACCVRACRVV
ncbi:hypothetical protein GCK32_013933 [Trichostrongylus colubriformis]|uniref:Uncharacterized protein n=1 Tax=Trichostrongylus colubriformis TaxID=6319 RepID=A0AAN8IBK8_TRICO